MLHKHVLFIGDKPGFRNLDPEIAFVGTRSYVTLLNWIARMDVSIYNIKLINSSEPTAKDDITSYAQSGGKIIALGETAANLCEEMVVPHFKMPHPSGRNKINNDKTKIKNYLYECRKYIYKNEDF